MTIGSCQCGGIKFQVEEFLRDLYKCHCSRCRKVSGASSSSAAISAQGKFAWLQGKELRSFYMPKDSDYGTYFCSICGSVVPLYLEDQDRYWIPCGLLDSDPGIPFTAHICTDSKASWDILDNQTEHYPEVFSLALVELWFRLPQSGRLHICDLRNGRISLRQGLRCGQAV
jgi:hypothetical protein